MLVAQKELLRSFLESFQEEFTYSSEQSFPLSATSQSISLAKEEINLAQVPLDNSRSLSPERPLPSLPIRTEKDNSQEMNENLDSVVTR
jgi:hypothetical protein